MPAYFELAPPARLANSVECLWVMQQREETPACHRVLPDGCADLLFTTSGVGQPSLQAIGPMTRFEDFQIPSGRMLVGLRFHPGMWTTLIGVPASQITDGVIPLVDLWGPRARTLLDQLSDCRGAADCAKLLAQGIGSDRTPSAVQRALAWMRQQCGVVSLDRAASQAGISPRQFRRLCLEQAGLSPKLLARILRFRYAVSRVRQGAGQHAGLAADCGYFDQSHFIADFRRFSGQTPSAFSSL